MLVVSAIKPICWKLTYHNIMKETDYPSFDIPRKLGSRNRVERQQHTVTTSQPDLHVFNTLFYMYFDTAIFEQPLNVNALATVPTINPPRLFTCMYGWMPN